MTHILDLSKVRIKPLYDDCPRLIPLIKVDNGFMIDEDSLPPEQVKLLRRTREKLCNKSIDPKEPIWIGRIPKNARLWKVRND